MVNRHSTLSILALIAILVVLARGIVFVVDSRWSDQEFSGGQEFDVDRWLEIARNLVNGKGYSLTTYGASDEPRPTAVRGPTVVYFFVALLWFFGDHPWLIVIAQWLVEVGTCAILFFIGIELFQDRRVAFTACLFFAFYVPGMIFTFRAWSEPVFTLVLAGFTLSLLRALRHPSVWRYALCGALLGLAVMARPVMQFYPLVILPILVWATERHWTTVLSRFAVFVVAFAIVLSPWVVRNYLVFDAFIPGSLWSGRPFYEGNFVLDRPDYLRHRGSEEGNLAFQKVLEARLGPAPDSHDAGSYARIKGISELEIDRIASQESVKLVQTFPGRYAILSTVRLFRFWFHHRLVTFVIIGGKLPKAASIAVVNLALLGLAGAALMWFRGPWLHLAVPLIVLIAYNSAVYGATNAVGRYSVPIMPYIMLFAAHTVVQLLAKWRVSEVSTRY